MIHTEFMSKRQLAQHNKMLAKIDDLNNTFPVGETVKVKKDDGTYEEDKITNPFSIVSGGIVAWLEKNRCYLAERVEKIEQSDDPEYDAAVERYLNTVGKAETWEERKRRIHAFRSGGR